MPAKPREGDADPTPTPARGGSSESIAAAQDGVASAARRGRQGAAGTDAGGNADAPAGLAGADPAAARAFVDNLAGDPGSVAGRSAQDIAAQFTAAGYPATIQQSTRRGTSGNAVQVRIQGHPEITNVQVHPGGGRHTPAGSTYWKISTNTAGRTWVIPGDFRGAEELSGNVVRYDE